MSHPKIFPVIHHIDRLTTLNEVAIARRCGADGVFLISHVGEDDELLCVAWEAKQMNRLFPIGVNLLSKSADLAATLACQSNLDMVWSDNMGVSSSGLTAMGERIKVIAGLHPQVLFFASVAFKYQAAELLPVLAAQNARAAGFIPTTSGERTGSAPDLTKIFFMSKDSEQTLAIASGMTPENVARFAPRLSHILVSTGVSKDEHHLDPVRLSAFVEAVRNLNALNSLRPLLTFSPPETKAAMFTQRRTEYTLEIYGPRHQAWRPAHGIHGDVLKDAIKLAEQGQSALAIDRASDLWIAQYGHMHDISFRVRCSIEEIHAHSLKGFKDELSTADVSG